MKGRGGHNSNIPIGAKPLSSIVRSIEFITHITKIIISCFVKTRNNFFSLEMEAINNYFYAHTGTLGTSDSPAFMENMHSAWINSQVNNVPRL